jgi:NAD(P)-dependent dehydrogenase (short-subunit alcohol dehydrogenase family)/pimeloyl-ACP methyl ester carboxylesterase
MTAMQESFVESADGVRIAVYAQGNPTGPTVVLLHGWPDSHVLWDGVVPLLADRFRVITYDNRGAGRSDAPRRVASFAMARYADDFQAVLDAVAPGSAVHVLAHDWGSVGVWEYLARPESGQRVASFTSVSGPSTDHLNRFVVGNLLRPYRPRKFAQAVAQLGRLSYMGLFSIPVLAPTVVRASFRTGHMRRVHPGNPSVSDAVASMKVYPANFFRALAHARPDHHVDVPVQLVVNAHDPFVRHYVYDETDRWASRLWRRDLRAGHWAPMSHPAVLATAVTELAEHVDGAEPARGLRRAQVGRDRKHFGDMLVSVTGAGSGIGRETALAFAAEGAELIVSDIDEAAASDTAARIAARGGEAHAYRLDVSDAEAVEAFAARVCDEHGVPDVVVNNAGIGQAGAFLDTPADQWDRVLDVNLGGVVNGCRAFAGRLVERGTGGHVVNVSSMAAYAPLQSMNAYCTSKAAVYMFSDCLRAELSSAGIGLTTVCPGVIDTNIVHTTRFDPPPGKAGQVAGRRKQLEAMFAARRYGPDKVAKAIVSAVRKNKPIRPVAPEAYLLYGTSRIAPQALRSTARGNVM